MTTHKHPTASDKFTESGESVVLTQCVYCARLVSSGGLSACPAFPGNIPGAIVGNRFDHRHPFPAGEAVSAQFVPRDGVPPAALARLYAALDLVPPNTRGGR